MHIPEGLTALDLDVIKLTVRRAAAEAGAGADWNAVDCCGLQARRGRVGQCLTSIGAEPRVPPTSCCPVQAQFVARNGKSFLTGLASREHANPQVHCSRLMQACRELRAEQD